MIARFTEKKLKEMVGKFPIVSLTGPRQSGKSTLLRYLFPDHRYVSLEDPDIQMQAREDPRGFLRTFDRGTILDEVQNCPELFSYLQTKVDETGDPGQYILSGSQNFLLMEKITQSLAGRVYIMTLLPFSYTEIENSGLEPKTEKWIYTGSYPRIYDKNIDPLDYYPSYFRTYVERDVRSVKRITDLTRFDRFVKLCAARIGQVLNITSLANDCGITAVTAAEWLSVLEGSYIIFRLQPYYNNYNKRLIKSPKLYFYDTGLACNLLGIKSEEALTRSDMYGSLFENMIIAEQKKMMLSKGIDQELYFWRDSNGVEVDLVKEEGSELKLIEIKGSSTMNKGYIKNLKKVAACMDLSQKNCAVYYDGDIELAGKDASFIPWKSAFRAETQDN